MELFDDLIQKAEALLSGKRRILPLPKRIWNTLSEETMIFRDEAKIDFGGESRPAVSTLFVTSDPNKIPQDEITLIGDDISDCQNPQSYARILTLLVDENGIGKTKEQLFQALQRLDYIRYHLFPEGVQLRISPLLRREEIRISKEAYQKGISFADLGKLWIEAYRRISFVRHVQITFITSSAFDYPALRQIAEKEESITKALDHLLRKTAMDCHSCKLQVICNDVEKMVNQDFPKE